MTYASLGCVWRLPARFNFGTLNLGKDWEDQEQTFGAIVLNVINIPVNC